MTDDGNAGMVRGFMQRSAAQIPRIANRRANCIQTATPVTVRRPSKRETGVQSNRTTPRTRDCGACPEPDPGGSGMTGLRLVTSQDVGT
jgi:hypothetical protein